MQVQIFLTRALIIQIFVEASLSDLTASWVYRTRLKFMVLTPYHESLSSKVHLRRTCNNHGSNAEYIKLKISFFLSLRNKVVDTALTYPV